MPSLESTSNSDKPKPSAAIQVAARLLAEGQPSEAIRYLEALSHAVPAYAAGQVLLAKAYEAEQHWDDALNAWHRAYFLAPSSPLIQRERRRLLDAQADGTDVQPPAEPPPIPDSDYRESPADDVEEQVAGDSDVEDELEALPPEQQEVEEQENALGTGKVRSPDEILEPPSANDFHDPELDDDMPEVFVQDSVPVSDALGPGVTAEMWDDSESHIDVHSSGVEEPAVSAPDMEGKPDEPIQGGADGDTAWWKQSQGLDEERSSEDTDTGWSVLAEMEAERVDEVATEARITAPEPDVPTRAETGSEEATLADDLDSLIQQLEEAPRIRPDPSFTAPEDMIDDDEADDMVSETLARIYVAQGQYKEAADVYDKLADQHPEQASIFSEKAEDLRVRGSRSS